jgi:hypothetical protein
MSLIPAMLIDNDHMGILHMPYIPMMLSALKVLLPVEFNLGAHMHVIEKMGRFIELYIVY